MRKLFLTLLFALAATARAQETITSSGDALSAAQSAAQKQQSSTRCMQSAQKAYWDSVPEERKAIGELQKLAAQKKKALLELRQGFYCSRCMRTASEIEAQEHIAFQKHLQNVKGVPVPAPASVVRQKSDEFDRKINDAAATQQRAQQKEKKAQVDYARCSAELANAQTVQQQMLAAAEALKAQEEARDEQRRALEIQQKLQAELQQIRRDFDAKKEQLGIEMMQKLQDGTRQKQMEQELLRQQAEADRQAQQEQEANESRLHLPNLDFSATKEALQQRVENLQERISALVDTVKAKAGAWNDKYQETANTIKEWKEDLNLDDSTGPRGRAHRLLTRLGTVDEMKEINKDPNAKELMKTVFKIGDDIVDTNEKYDPEKTPWQNIRKNYVPEFDSDKYLRGEDAIDYKTPGKVNKWANKYWDALMEYFKKETGTSLDKLEIK